MRVLLVTPFFYPKAGGIESHLFEVIGSLRDVQFNVLTNRPEGRELHRVLFPEVGFSYVWPSDWQLQRLYGRRSWGRLHGALKSGLELLRMLNRAGWIDRLECDLVHIHYFDTDQLDHTVGRLGLERLKPLWYRLISSKARETPMLFTDHTFFSAPEEVVSTTTKNALLDSFQNVISVDRASYKIVEAHHRVHGGRVWFIPNSVDTDRFAREPASHDGFTVGYAARPWKLGEELLHGAIRELGGEVKWHFAIGGDQMDLGRTKLRSFCPTGLFTANLDYTRMPSFYNSIDVLVNPFPAEGVGRTTLEAMSCGVPVVGVGTTEKYPLESGVTGFLVPPDSQAIAEKIRNLKDHPELARSFGRKAREIIETEYSNRVLLPRLRCVYETLIQENASLAQ